jgi:hypothetical protein
MKVIILMVLWSLLNTSYASGSESIDLSKPAILAKGWSLQLGNGYSSNKSNGVHNIVKENSVGSLQLSSMVKGSEILDSEILQMAEAQVMGRGKLEKLEKGEKRGYISSFSHDGVYWVYWFIVIKRSLIMATYNSDADKLKLDEVDDARELIATIKSN